MPWLQLKIHSDPDHVPAIETSLLGNGAVSVTFQDAADQPILEPALNETPLWDQTIITGLFDAGVDTRSISERIGNLSFMSPSQLRWEQLEDKDWEREWMKNYHPIDCGNQLWICPSWISPPAPDATNLMLDPGLAFGTGTHPTTFLCLQWLAKLAVSTDFSETECLDYGCGSGILGIAALLLGAKSAAGVDIDPQALLATQDNCQRNEIEANRFPVFLPSDAPKRQYDMVLANILAGPLVELSDQISQAVKTGGRLCLSGIIAEQEQATIAAYSNHFDFEPTESREEWICLTAIKK